MGFGAAGIRTFHLTPPNGDYRRTSNISIGWVYTLEKQILLFNEFKLFFNESRSRIFGEVGYYDFFYYYYGLGNDALVENEESYDVRFPRLMLTYLHEVKRNLYVGARYHFDNYNITQLDSTGQLLRDQINGYQGGVVSSLGAVVQYDSRDNVFFPEKGFYFNNRFMVAHEGLGADYNYIRFSSDMRFFKKVYKGTVLGLHNYMGVSSEGIPFQELFIVGGPKRGRGLISGRFRGQYNHVLQAEVRFPIYKRISGTGFIGGYRVSMDEFKTVIDNPKITYGMGLRYMLNKKDRLNIRTDFAFSEDGAKFYFTIGEAF